MVDFLLHAYKKGTEPFRSLTTLPEGEALGLMKSLYVEGSLMWERFSDPIGYLTFRKHVEDMLRAGFMAKGGRPIDACPIYMLLGRPRWITDEMDDATRETTEEIAVPLRLFDPSEISFTFPDSMASAELAAEKNPEHYEPEYHGRVFTLKEIEKIVEKRGMPGDEWKSRLHHHRPHYVEAQVWNHGKLRSYYRALRRCL